MSAHRPSTTRSRRRPLGLTVVIASVTSLIAVGCASGPPTRDQFVDKMADTVGLDLAETLGSGSENRSERESDAVDEAIHEFLECVYDKIRDDVELLEAVYDDPAATEVSAQLETLTTTCTERLNSTVDQSTTPSPTTTTTAATTTVPLTTTTVQVGTTTTTPPSIPTSASPTSIDVSTSVDTSDIVEIPDQP